MLVKLGVKWISRYRYEIVSRSQETRYYFDSVENQAENHAKILELLLETQDQVDKLKLQIHMMQRLEIK